MESNEDKEGTIPFWVWLAFDIVGTVLYSCTLFWRWNNLLVHTDLPDISALTAFGIVALCGFIGSVFTDIPQMMRGVETVEKSERQSVFNALVGKKVVAPLLILGVSFLGAVILT